MRFVGDWRYISKHSESGTLLGGD